MYSQRPPAPPEERGIPVVLEQRPACGAFHSGTRATWNRNSLVSEIRDFKPELVFSAVISQQAPAAEFAAVCVCARVSACASVQQPRSSPPSSRLINVPSSPLLPSLHHWQPQSDRSQPPLLSVEKAFTGITTDFFPLLPPRSMRSASPPSPLTQSSSV